MPNFSYSTWQTDGGLIKPVAGFRSGNGNFLYISTRGATAAKAVSKTSSTRSTSASVWAALLLAFALRWLA